ncbi:Plant invertase/pectin methylesterase inhibitor superfamily protein [Striga hermonthica]|uniref:Plant invertase/pectin methylesterase inhibitor superfamily protein n=1 Tax=Striga hermonthica TaxID=68872 RepID=A0A9N7NHE4_STRHE|nr:Plant invertase/pectin methylesterase inhibitor superfamily protein [Striga hermonthica]
MAIQTTQNLSLIILISFLYALSASATGNPIDFIRSSCRDSFYYSACVSSLAPYAGKVKESPRLLAMMALSISAKRARDAQFFLKTVAKYPSGLSQKEKSALKDCLEVVGNTVGQLNDSIVELKKLGRTWTRGEFSWRLSNVMTWVSAALTNEGTCKDGFSSEALDSDLKPLIDARIGNMSMATSNALAICNKFSGN